jgi:hypothetical protein
MSGIKLVNSEDFVILNKKNDSYVISNTKQWIFLSTFTKAYLLIDFPYGKLETPIDVKFVYNQDFMLSNDLDFKYKYIQPIGNLEIGNLNHQYNKIPFTGSLNGNNFIIKNINLIDCENTGLFGVMRSATVRNLILQNIVIQSSQYAGGLVAKGYDIVLSNIKIVGNIFINGNKTGILAGLLEANCENILICVDGEINSQARENVTAVFPGDASGLISYYFHGSLENTSVISNINNSPGLFYDINGRIKNIGLISFNTITRPFFNKSNYYQISNCYYFQLNTNTLPPIQDSYNSFYRNLSNDILISDETDLNLIGWIKIDDFYYSTEIINYSNENLETDLIKYYDWSSEKTNIDGFYIGKNLKIYHNNMIFSEPYSRENILNQCKNMEKDFINEQNLIEKYNMEILHNRKEKMNKLLQIFKEMDLLDIAKNDELSDNNSTESELSETTNINSFNRNIRFDAQKMALEQINKLNMERINQ